MPASEITVSFLFLPLNILLFQKYAAWFFTRTVTAILLVSTVMSTSTRDKDVEGTRQTSYAQCNIFNFDDSKSTIYLLYHLLSSVITVLSVRLNVWGSH